MNKKTVALDDIPVIVVRKKPKIKYAYLKYGARKTKSFSGVGYDDTIEKNDDILNELDINMRFNQESGNFDLDKLSW